MLIWLCALVTQLNRVLLRELPRLQLTFPNQQSMGCSKRHVILSQGTFLRRKVDASALDLAVQEVSIGTKEDGGSGEDPGEGDSGGSASCGTTSPGHRSAGSLETRKDVVDVLTASFVGVVDIHVLLTLGGHLPALFADLVDVVVVVVVLVVVLSVVLTVVVVLVVLVVVLVVLLAVNALVSDQGRTGERKLLSVVVGGPDGVVGTVDTAGIVENTQVNGLAVMVGAVGTNEVLAVELAVLPVLSVLVVVVVLLVLHLCWD